MLRSQDRSSPTGVTTAGILVRGPHWQGCMALDKERLKKRWWLYSRLETFILGEVAYYKKYKNEIQLPGQTVWTWDEEEVRTELNVDTR